MAIRNALSYLFRVGLRRRRLTLRLLGAILLAAIVCVTGGRIAWIIAGVRVKGSGWELAGGGIPIWVLDRLYVQNAVLRSRTPSGAFEIGARYAVVKLSLWGLLNGRLDTELWSNGMALDVVMAYRAGPVLDPRLLGLHHTGVAHAVLRGNTRQTVVEFEDVPVRFRDQAGFVTGGIQAASADVRIHADCLAAMRRCSVDGSVSALRVELGTRFVGEQVTARFQWRAGVLTTKDLSFWIGNSSYFNATLEANEHGYMLHVSSMAFDLSALYVLVQRFQRRSPEVPDAYGVSGALNMTLTGILGSRLSGEGVLELRGGSVDGIPLVNELERLLGQRLGLRDEL